MAKKNKPPRRVAIAYVTGTKPQYVLQIHRYMGAEDFEHLNWMVFKNYRAAQDIANAINDHVYRKDLKAWQKTKPV